MNEKEFIQLLQNRAKEQRKIMQGMFFPRIFQLVSIWLGEHPWRILIPIAFLLSLFFHDIFGKTYDDLILKIFGGFGLIKLR